MMLTYLTPQRIVIRLRNCIKVGAIHCDSTGSPRVTLGFCPPSLQGTSPCLSFREVALERVMDLRREYRLPDGGRDTRRRRSATPPKRWVASRNPSLAA